MGFKKNITENPAEMSYNPAPITHYLNLHHRYYYCLLIPNQSLNTYRQMRVLFGNPIALQLNLQLTLDF